MKRFQSRILQHKFNNKTYKQQNLNFNGYPENLLVVLLLAAFDTSHVGLKSSGHI